MKSKVLSLEELPCIACRFLKRCMINLYQDGPKECSDYSMFDLDPNRFNELVRRVHEDYGDLPF